MYYSVTFETMLNRILNTHRPFGWIRIILEYLRRLLQIYGNWNNHNFPRIAKTALGVGYMQFEKIILTRLLFLCGLM